MNIKRNLLLSLTMIGFLFAFVYAGCASKTMEPAEMEEMATTEEMAAEEAMPMEDPMAGMEESSGMEALGGIPSDLNLGKVFFGYDRSTLDSNGRKALRIAYEQLSRFSNLNVIIEGHCDERGSVEYNLALGDRRAESIRQYLLNLGLPASRMTTISYGKERPASMGSNEQAFRQNRRGEFVVTEQ